MLPGASSLCGFVKSVNSSDVKKVHSTTIMIRDLRFTILNFSTDF